MKAKEIYTAFTKADVLAILAGRKWQTRRVIKPQPRRVNDDFDGTWEWKEREHYYDDLTLADTLRRHCPWQPDDLMCVKEAYQVASNYGSRVNGYYLADDTFFSVELASAEFARWKARKFPYRVTSGRFMYNSFCRVKAPVIWSRVECVQDISYDDIDAEDTPPKPEQMSYRSDYYQRLKDFGYFWNKINPKFPFESNPWVFVIEFEREEQ